MKVLFDVDTLKYIDSIFYQCGKKASTLGIHNDSEKIIFFLPTEQLRFEFLSDLKIAIKSFCPEKFSIGIEFEVFRKLLVKSGSIEFDIGNTHVNITTYNSNHKFKITQIEYPDVMSDVSSGSDGYELFTTNIAVPISSCFIPVYDTKTEKAIAISGSFEGNVNVLLTANKIIVTTTNKLVITRYIETVIDKSFSGHNVSIPLEAINFILSTMKEINLFKLYITDSFMRIVLFDVKHETSLRYDLKLASVKFPNCDNFLIHGDDTFSIDCQLFKDFISSFISIRNQDLKEVISLKLNNSMLQCFLVHSEHESFSELKVDLIKPNDVTIYLDMELLKGAVKNIPKNVKLLIGLFETKLFIFSEDKKFQAVVSGMDPKIIASKASESESNKENYDDRN